MKLLVVALTAIVATCASLQVPSPAVGQHPNLLRGGGFSSADELFEDVFEDTSWGLDASQLIAGVDSESDGNLFDGKPAISRKAQYVCSQGLAGMVSWRLDNDNVEKGKPTFKAAKQVLYELQKCSGCKWDARAGWSIASPRENSTHNQRSISHCPIIGGYVGAFDSGFFCDNLSSHGQCRYKHLPFEMITRLYIAFIYVQGGECKFRYHSQLGPVNDKRRQDFKDMIKFARSKNPHLEVYLTSGLDLSQYNGCQSKGLRDVFADSLLSVLKELDADGYDMDWENGIIEPMISTLIQTVSAKFKAAFAKRPEGRLPYGITMAVANKPEAGFDFGLIKDHVNQLNLMTYGSHRSLGQSVLQYTNGVVLND